MKKMIDNCMNAPIRVEELPCPECRGKGFKYPYDEHLGRSKREMCEDCGGIGTVLREY